MKNEPKLPPMAQLYHRHRDREYLVKHQGLIFSHEEVVRTERMGSTLELAIETPNGVMPDKIIFNGKEHQLITL